MRDTPVPNFAHMFRAKTVPVSKLRKDVKANEPGEHHKPPS